MMIDTIKKELQERIAKLPITIIASAIYGSWARGAQTGDSDSDILLISENVNPTFGEPVARVYNEAMYAVSPLPINITVQRLVEMGACGCYTCSLRLPPYRREASLGQ